MITDVDLIRVSAEAMSDADFKAALSEDGFVQITDKPNHFNLIYFARGVIFEDQQLLPNELHQQQTGCCLQSDSENT